MHKNTPVVCQQSMQYADTLVNHRNERIDSPPPSVSICYFLDDTRFFRQHFPITDFEVYRKVRTNIKRGVDINELHSTHLVYFLSQRPIFQRSEHQLVLAPDEFIAPAPRLTTRPRVEIKQPGYVSSCFRPWLVDLLDGLKRQHHAGDF